MRSIPQEVKTTLYLYRTLPIKEIEVALGINRSAIYRRIWKAKEDFPDIDCTGFTTLRKEQKENYSENLLEREQLKKQWFAHRQGILQHGSIKGYIKKKGFIVSPSFLKTITNLTTQEIKEAKRKANVRTLHKRYDVIHGEKNSPTKLQLKSNTSLATMIFYYYKSFNDFIQAHESGDYYNKAIR